jgi:EmrB/QacA subfamily drug resistance transporter
MFQANTATAQRRFDPRWLPLIVTTIGAFMSILDSNIVNIALETILKDFHADLGSGQFVVTAYIMALAVMIPLSGVLGERIGFKRLYIITLACFTAGSALCGLAWNLPSLIVFRVLQGIGGGMLQPLGMAIVFQIITPLERPKFIALLGVPALIAPIMGPSLGGYIVQYASWRMVFLINIPIGILDVLLAFVLLKNLPGRRGTRFDARGFVFAAIAFPALVFALGNAADGGWTAPGTLAAFAVGLVGAILFARLEWRLPDPMLRLRLFADPLFRLSLAVQYIGFFSLFGLNFMLPLYLQVAYGWGPAETGSALLPMGIVAFVTMNLSARRYNRLGPRPLACASLIVLSLTTLLWTRVGVNTGFPFIVVLVCFRGLALGLFAEAVQMCTYNAVPEGQIPRATALVNTAQRLIGAVSTALIATILIVSLSLHGAPAGASIVEGTAPPALTITAFRDAFYFMTGLSVVGIVLSLFLQDRVLMAQQASKRAESAGSSATAAPAVTVATDEPTPAASLRA